MIIGIGMDLVEVERVATVLARHGGAGGAEAVHARPR
jgi:phosphopantetheinyl transferase (holo-ACP synthase)